MTKTNMEVVDTTIDQATENNDLPNHMATIYSTEYTLSKTKHGERLKQSDAILLKDQLEELILPLISDTLDIDITLTDKGYLLHVPNEILGAIYVEMQLVTKPLDIDVVGLDEEGLAKKARRAVSKTKADDTKVGSKG